MDRVYDTAISTAVVIVTVIPLIIGFEFGLRKLSHWYRQMRNQPNVLPERNILFGELDDLYREAINDTENYHNSSNEVDNYLDYDKLMQTCADVKFDDMTAMNEEEAIRFMIDIINRKESSQINKIQVECCYKNNKALLPFKMRVFSEVKNRLTYLTFKLPTLLSSRSILMFDARVNLLEISWTSDKYQKKINELEERIIHLENKPYDTAFWRSLRDFEKLNKLLEEN